MQQGEHVRVARRCANLQFGLYCADGFVILLSVGDNRSSDFLKFGVVLANGYLQLRKFIAERNDFLSDKGTGIAAFGNLYRLKISRTQLRQSIAVEIDDVRAAGFDFFLRI